MLIYNSNQEGIWIKLEKIDSVISKNNSPLPHNRVILDEIENNSINNIYLENKPQIDEDDIYSFISSNIYIDGDRISGLINYLLNDKHIQHRF
jgi:hypothetical protein